MSTFITNMGYVWYLLGSLSLYFPYCFCCHSNRCSQQEREQNYPHYDRLRSNDLNSLPIILVLILISVCGLSLVQSPWIATIMAITPAGIGIWRGWVLSQTGVLYHRSKEQVGFDFYDNKCLKMVGWVLVGLEVFIILTAISLSVTYRL